MWHFTGENAESLMHHWILLATRVSEKLIETWNPQCVVSGSEDDSPHLDTVTSPKSGLQVAMKTVFSIS